MASMRRSFDVRCRQRRIAARLRCVPPGKFNKEWAFDFWKFYAPRYKDGPHVIYEIHNEPVQWAPPYNSPKANPPGAVEMNAECWKLIRSNSPIYQQLASLRRNESPGFHSSTRLSFAEGADLSKVTVQATIGESTSPAIFAIVNDNEAYSLEYVGYPFHLGELDLSWMTSGWEHPVANKSIYSISDGSYTSLRLWNGSDWQSYSKGISVQAESHLIIKLGGN